MILPLQETYINRIIPKQVNQIPILNVIFDMQVGHQEVKPEENAILGGVRELFDHLNNILKPLFLQLYIHFVSRQVCLTQQVHVLAFWAWIIRFFIWGT